MVLWGAGARPCVLLRISAYQNIYWPFNPGIIWGYASFYFLIKLLNLILVLPPDQPILGGKNIFWKNTLLELRTSILHYMWWILNITENILAPAVCPKCTCPAILCKAQMHYLLICKVSRYCLLGLHDRAAVQYNISHIHISVRTKTSLWS